MTSACIRCAADLAQVAAGSRGMCSRCYQAALRTGEIESRSPLPWFFELEVAEQTLAHATDLIAGELVASLVAIIDWAVTAIREVGENEKLRPVDIRKALGQIADRAAAARLGVHDANGPRW